MTAQPVPANRDNLAAGIAAEIAGMTEEAKLQALTACLGKSAENFLRMALLVKSLEEEHGRDLSHLKGLRIIESLRLIACGRLHPELLARYGPSGERFALFGSLPYTEQQRIVEGGRFRLLVYTPDGSLTHRNVLVEEMQPEQVRQVFERGRVRDDAGQRSYLDALRLRSLVRKQAPEKIGRWIIDPERSAARIGNYECTLAELQAVVRALKKQAP